MDKDKEKARNRKPESASTSGSGSAGQHKDKDDKEKGKDKKEKEGLIPTLYHNFVESLESALHSVAGRIYGNFGKTTTLIVILNVLKN